MSKPAVTTRIPHFFSNIPQKTGAPVNAAPNTTTATAPAKPPLTAKDIGSRVKVGEKHGVLRFVGHVNFAKGTWCGVELTADLGKNDGSVNGVRYFDCAPGCGLMVPLCKTALDCDKPDDASGPYSMLFLDNRHRAEQNTFSVDQLDGGAKEDFGYFGAKRRKINTDVTYPYPVTTLASSTPTKTVKPADLFVKCRISDIYPDEDDRSKRSSLDYEESLGILTPDQMTDGYLNEAIENSQNTPLHINTIYMSETTYNLLTEKRNQKTDLNQDEEFKTNSLDSTFVNKQESDNNLTITNANADYYCNKLTSETFKCPSPNERLEETFKLQEEGLNETIVRNSRRGSHQNCTDLSLGILSDTLINKCDTSKYLCMTDPTFKLTEETANPEVQSPNLVDASVTEYSLGLLDEHLLSNLSVPPDTMNLALPLENVTASKDFRLSRIEQTPSPEDLPLDPTPVVAEVDLKDPSKAKPNSFITSITSITSLDTGYQGDGEMSRPASRAADSSPLTRRPQPKPQNHRQDPMTDSDFYTESDADNYEEQHLKGDRKAQVIDGTLYGVDAQAAASIYANNRETMDSSGVFTDVETNTRAETNDTFDVTPSDTSTKTVSENSQSNLQLKVPNKPVVPKENTKKRVISSPAAASPTNVKTPKSGSNMENASKKYKMPKRDVASKVKAMMSPNQNPNVEKKSVKKTVGRWDAVMDKISKNEQNKSNLKDVKSKVYVTNENNKTMESNKLNVRQSPNQKTPNTKLRRVKCQNLIGNQLSVEANKENVGLKRNTPLRRTRIIRTNFNLESIHSSLSDVSSTQLSKKASEKKKQINQTNDAKTKKYTASSKEKKPESPKILDNRNNAKSERQLIVGPSKRSQTTFNDDHRTVEALAILIQHLVFHGEAFSVPTLKNQIKSTRREVEEWKKSYSQLEESINEEKSRHLQTLEDERRLYKQITESLKEKHDTIVSELNQKHAQLEASLTFEKDNLAKQLKKQQDEQLLTLKSEFSKLEKNYAERLDILREENEAIWKQIDEKNAEIEAAVEKACKIRADYESREAELKKKLSDACAENRRLSETNAKLEESIRNSTESVSEENRKLREENDRLLSYGDEKGIGLQEVQSLRAVLELKQNEVGQLRKQLAEATQKLDILVNAEERANFLNAKCEDLKSQLQRKQEFEQSVVNENSKLQESLKEEVKQKARLSQHNEELQWKLKQNKEVINNILEMKESPLSRSLLNSSLNEKHSASRHSLERSFSFREHSYNSDNRSRRYRTSQDFNEDDSPPPSPKVKGVVAKSDSVSYVLDLDDSPDIVASRIVRRSFRNSTSPKTTPTKSPTNKTPKNPLSTSSSTSSMTKSRNDPFNNVFVWSSSPKPNKLDDNSDFDEENDDILLPALPSELNRQGSVQALPSPKHLAGEAMISESASEDESTSSSQL
ncbi:uncharacterized protein LOC109594782 isoform X3 [Aethina tumida]|uniref:uncharacterized protein LOC109594782 isoform X3 n=1 Tax=Aethina tumida TaxID=116153 RepID=UPI00214961D0|nr:uncharacterized protein LOC109594782 isoform X3 [Aethina tumida]